MGVLSKSSSNGWRPAQPLLLDAAIGTELQRRDADTTLPLWSARPLLRDPELVWTVHGDEVAAGADILTANTFRTHARSLAKAGLGSPPASSPRGPSSSPIRRRPLPGREVFVAGSLSPLEDCYRPDLVPDDAALALRTAPGRVSWPTPAWI